MHKGAKSLEILDELEGRAEMLEAIPEWSMVAWDTSNDDESAQWGEVMTMAAAKRGCRGAVIDGGTAGHGQDPGAGLSGIRPV